MERYPTPIVLVNGQNVSRYKARSGEKIKITAVPGVSDSFVKPSDPNQKTYGILFATKSQTGSECFSVRVSPSTSAIEPFCPVMPDYLRSLVPDIAPGVPAKAVELSYDQQAQQWKVEFQVESVSLCTDPPGCPSTFVGFYSAMPSDPKTISPLTRIPDNGVPITVNP